MKVAFPTIDEALALHAGQIDRYGGRLGARFLELLESALAVPLATHGGSSLHTGLDEMAAAYLFHPVKNHPFVDGNKRTGLMVMLAFLGLNGFRLEGGEMEPMFGDDLVYIHSSAAVDGKSSYIDTMRSGNVKYRSMKRSDVRVRTYGCLAIITGDADFDVSVKGQELSVQLRFHSVWAKRGGSVQFVSWQATRAPAGQ